VHWASGVKKLHDRLEVERLILSIDGGALCETVGEELVELGFRDEFRWFGSCLGGPHWSLHQEPGDQWGPLGTKQNHEVRNAMRKQHAATVTAALRWRGRCLHQRLRAFLIATRVSNTVANAATRKWRLDAAEHGQRSVAVATEARVLWPEIPAGRRICGHRNPGP
jgi:hypothetical protein